MKNDLKSLFRSTLILQINMIISFRIGLLYWRKAYPLLYVNVNRYSIYLKINDILINHLYSQFYRIDPQILFNHVLFPDFYYSGSYFIIED